MCAQKLWEKTNRTGDSRATVFNSKLPCNMMAFALHLHPGSSRKNEGEMKSKEDPGQEQEWIERQSGQRRKGKSDLG